MNVKNFFIFATIGLLNVIMASQIPKEISNTLSVYLTYMIGIAYGAAAYKFMKED